MILIWKLEVNINYVVHKPQGVSFSFEPMFAKGRKSFSLTATNERKEVGERWCSTSGCRAHTAGARRLQQVHSAVIQEVGCAVSSGLHHLVLVNHLDHLVVDAQPAVQTDLEDVCGVMAPRRAAAVMVDHWKRAPGRRPGEWSTARRQLKATHPPGYLQKSVCLVQHLTKVGGTGKRNYMKQCYLNTKTLNN